MLQADPAFRLAILTTGGTIDKTYDETDGSLRNVRSVLVEILSNLRLVDLSIKHVPVMSKDSLDMTAADRECIVDAVRAQLPINDAVVVIHGTDTLSATGEQLAAKLSGLEIPVLLTGAFRPFEFRDTDALQNVTESLLAARLLPAGVYAVMHGRALSFPGVVKHRGRGTFVRGEAQSPSQSS
jgi:L-asparaginase